MELHNFENDSFKLSNLKLLKFTFASTVLKLFRFLKFFWQNRLLPCISWTFTNSRRKHRRTEEDRSLGIIRTHTASGLSPDVQGAHWSNYTTTNWVTGTWGINKNEFVIHHRSQLFEGIWSDTFSLVLCNCLSTSVVSRIITLFLSSDLGFFFFLFRWCHFDTSIYYSQLLNSKVTQLLVKHLWITFITINNLHYDNLLHFKEYFKEDLILSKCSHKELLT